MDRLHRGVHDNFRTAFIIAGVLLVLGATSTPAGIDQNVGVALNKPTAATVTKTKDKVGLSVHTGYCYRRETFFRRQAFADRSFLVICRSQCLFNDLHNGQIRIFFPEAF